MRIVVEVCTSGWANMACASSCPGNASGDLRQHVGSKVTRGKLAPQSEDQGHGRVEVRARKWPEGRDENDQDRPCRQRIGEKREGRIGRE